MTEANQRFLVFRLGNEEYALPLLSVKEVIALPETTKVPHSPHHFLGIMNLRGQVISILDLRAKLGITSKNSAETGVIICDLNPYCLGVVVDSINAVITPKPESLTEKPEIHNDHRSDYIKSVFRYDHKLILIIDLYKALDLKDIQTIERNTA